MVPDNICFCGFSILVLILDKLVPGIDLHLSTLLTVSVHLPYLDLSIDLPLSVLLLLDVSNVLFDACDFSVFLLCQFFFWNRRSDGFPHHITFCFPFFSTVPVVPYLTTMSIVVTNVFLISPKYPLAFLTLSLGLSYFLGNGSMVLDEMISVPDILHNVNSITSSSLL